VTKRFIAGVGATLLAVVAAPLAAVLPADADEGSLGDLTDFEVAGDTYTLTSGSARLRLSFEDDDLLRVWLAPDGTFTDPANDDPGHPDAPDADIVVKRDYPGAGSTYVDTDDSIVIRTDAAALTVTKSPITLELADADGTQLWRETEPLAWTDDETTQALTRGSQEQFFGGGMQNGRFSHRDETITVSTSYNWNDGGNPNAVPFYVSSNGYGVLRNTFARGSYDFGEPVSTTHDEERFDAYYFVGDAKEVIDGYTELTGRPVMLPMYALEIGDADCYLHNANRGERETLRDSGAVAEGYSSRGIPLGWMLVNDGYGCGYEQLPETAQMLHDNGIELGLWTESDLTEQEYEVESGVRVRKTDVAWVGSGYRFGLDACEKSRDGIEDYSADRATVLTVEGWAGTQRCAATWSGDQSGSWEYIRWQIPTYAGSTMSGLHVSTGDVDGIFGGSPKTYVRDLQWKMMLPMTYMMNGWAASDKQPWRYGSPYTEINKKYLLLHERLLPYLYTYTAGANSNGVGATRPLVLNYPDDPNTWGDSVKYEFLAGDDFLVAPVYQDTTVRDGIYLPEGDWVDYWTGRVYSGNQTVDGYRAPLDTLPLFVRAGAIVPMFPEGTIDWAEGKAAGQLDLDIYPQGSSTFTNYEDDGRTRAYAAGEHAKQRFDVEAPESGSGAIEVRIGALDGQYDGRPEERRYQMAVHTNKSPDTVRIGSQHLELVADAAALEEADAGWFYEPETGIAHVKTPTISTSSAATVHITGASAVGGDHPGELQAEVDLLVPAVSAAGEPSDVAATFTNETGKPVQVTGTELSVPQGWAVTATGPTTATDLPDGDTFTAPFTVTPPADGEPGEYELSAVATYVVRDVERATGDRVGTTLAHANLAAAFNNVGITSLDDPDSGDLDGGGSSFIAERLAEKGWTPGAELTANDWTFELSSSQPGTEDNVASTGETIKFSGQGNTLAFLGTGTSGAAGGTATVHYTDGSTSTATLGFPNWCCLATDTYGAEIAVETKGKNVSGVGESYPNVDYRLYTSTISVDEAKEVAAVTLPGNAAVHVFAMNIGTEEIVPPPIEPGQYALGNIGSGLNLEAPGDAVAQLQTGEPSADPAQKWVLSQHDDGTYQVKNAASGQCMDVFYSSTDDGALVGQYTCTGTSNQRWIVENSDGVLSLKAKHSSLFLTADPDGLAVQASDTGDDARWWNAVPN
jgi:alpha-glucosidase (family GH31 glycosyl hydrolase)